MLAAFTVNVPLPILIIIQDILIALGAILMTRFVYVGQIKRMGLSNVPVMAAGDVYPESRCQGLDCHRRPHVPTPHEKLAEFDEKLRTTVPCAWYDVFKRMQKGDGREPHKTPAEIFGAVKLNIMAPVKPEHRDLLAEAFALVDGRTGVQREYRKKLD